MALHSERRNHGAPGVAGPVPSRRRPRSAGSGRRRRRPGRAVVGLAAALALAVTIDAPASTYRAGRAAFDAGNYAEALRIWKPLAKAGSPGAQFGVGYILRHGGGGVAADPPEAVRWLELAGEGSRQPRAHVELAEMLLAGEGTPQDPQRAVRLLERASVFRSIRARVLLAKLYAGGRHVNRDRRLALEWFERAASSGDPAARFGAWLFRHLGGRGATVALAGLALLIGVRAFLTAGPWFASRRPPPTRAVGAGAGVLNVLAVLLVTLGTLVYLEFDAPEETDVDGLWVLASFAFLCVANLGLMAAHELAHALVGRLAGLRVVSVTVGVGPALLDARIRGVHVRVGLFVSHGAAQITSTSVDWLKPKMFATYAAGPLLNLALAVIAYDVIDGRISIAPAMSGFAPWLLLFYGNAFLLVQNLVPFGRVATDGHQMLALWFTTPARTEELLAVDNMVDAVERHRAGQSDAALEQLRNAAARWPENSTVAASLAFIMLHQGYHAEARKRLDALLEREDEEVRRVRPLLRAGVAYAAIVELDPDPDGLDEADRLSALALEAAPDVPFVRFARGAVSVCLGDLAAGIRSLRRVYWLATEPDVRGAAAAWLAIGEMRRDRPGPAARWLARARRALPGEPLLARAVDEVARTGAGGPGGGAAPGV